jgi:hypothetical protein
MKRKGIAASRENSSMRKRPSQINAAAESPLQKANALCFILFLLLPVLGQIPAGGTVIAFLTAGFPTFYLYFHYFIYADLQL